VTQVGGCDGNDRSTCKLTSADPFMLVNHAEDLAKVVQKALLLCEVAALAREFSLKSFRGGVQRAPSISKFGMSREEFDGIVRRNAELDDDSASGGGKYIPDDSSYHGGLIIDPRNSDPRRGILDQSEKTKINALLGAWYVDCSLLVPVPQSLYLTNYSTDSLFAGKNQKLSLVQRYDSSENERVPNDRSFLN
jgi:hypothetical protein